MPVAREALEIASGVESGSIYGVFVRQLLLKDFRSYPDVEVSLDAGPCIFIGRNGQGKTNLVEAIEYLSKLGSHRVAQDAPLIRMGQTKASIKAVVQASKTDTRCLSLEIDINANKANKAKINRADLPRTRDLLGVLRTVVFSPEDLAIVKGDPSDRRKFIDDLVITRWPRMAGVRLDYDRILKQRNALLKAMAGSYSQDDADAQLSLDIWSEQLANIGAELLSARLDILVEFNPYLTKSYQLIAPDSRKASIEYQSELDISPDGVKNPTPEVLAQRLLALYRENRNQEIARGHSLFGPHRDDMTLYLGELPAKGYASHGECWSVALACRLGSFSLLQAADINPVLILDDVFAELDAGRRKQLASSIVDADQILITAAVPEDVPSEIAGLRYRVSAGEVTLENPKQLASTDQLVNQTANGLVETDTAGSEAENLGGSDD